MGVMEDDDVYEEVEMMPDIDYAQRNELLR